MAVAARSLKVNSFSILLVEELSITFMQLKFQCNFQYKDYKRQESFGLFFFFLTNTRWDFSLVLIQPHLFGVLNFYFISAASSSVTCPQHGHKWVMR